jgi:hypothetical protein
VRWLALECLDHDRGTTEELQALVEHPDANVSLAAAATSAAWGTSPRLDVIRDAVLSGQVSVDLEYQKNPYSSMAWPGRIAKRLAEVLAPYGDIGLGRHFSENVDKSGAWSSDAVSWLFAFDPEEGIDAYLTPAGPRRGYFVTEVMIEVIPRTPSSRVHAIIEYCLRETSLDLISPECEKVLDWAAAAADDVESVALLLRFLPERGEEDTAEGRGSRSLRAYDLAYAVSRRARVRVLPDHTIVPLP